MHLQAQVKKDFCFVSAGIAILTAAMLAARFPVSRKHFERRFREAIGHSVLDEILNIRLENVTAYLLRRDIAIDTIAGRCGFGSEIELRRLFRRRFGMSMTAWRARNSVWGNALQND